MNWVTNSLRSDPLILSPGLPLKGEEDNDFPRLQDCVAIIESVSDKTEETVGWRSLRAATFYHEIQTFHALR
jgi:hypothetical protein